MAECCPRERRPTRVIRTPFLTFAAARRDISASLRSTSSQVAIRVTDTKESERAELHKTIWRIANDLRGSVDGWDFKSYVLGMLFYRFISENLTAYLNHQERKAGNKSFDYVALSDKQAKRGRDETVKEKGFYILPSQLFANVQQRARQDANPLNETLSKVSTVLSRRKDSTLMRLGSSWTTHSATVPYRQRVPRS
jgi:hypothetical protein